MQAGWGILVCTQQMLIKLSCEFNVGPYQYNTALSLCEAQKWSRSTSFIWSMILHHVYSTSLCYRRDVFFQMCSYCDILYHKSYFSIDSPFHKLRYIPVMGVTRSFSGGGGDGKFAYKPTCKAFKTIFTNPTSVYRMEE